MGVPVEHPQDRSSHASKRIVAEAEKRGRVVGVRLAPADEDDAAPWTAPPSRRRKEPPLAGPLPDRLELILGDQIYIAKDALPPGLRNRLVRLAAFQNPEFYKAQAMRLPTYDKPRIIACAEDHRAAHRLATGLPGRCPAAPVGPAHRRCRFETNAMPASLWTWSSRASCSPSKQAAAQAMLAHDTGVLSATTAFGKTVVAAWLIAQRGVNTLVLVHRRQLLEQWVERLSAFLGSAAKGHRPNRRRAKEADRIAGCGDHPKPGAKGRRE